MRNIPIILLMVVGCASGGPARTPLSPAELAELEREAMADSADAATRIKLGAAYRDAGRFDDAIGVLESVTADQPENAGAHLMLGFAREDAADWAGARAAYEQYLRLGRAADLKRSIEDRLAWVYRREVELWARRLAMEELEGTAAGPPEPGTVAVFPFHYRGTDQTLRPLGRALAELLVTDLSQTDRLRVLERVRVQLLLDELELAQTALVDPSTAARSGRRLRAATVVQGAIAGGAAQLELDAFMVPVEQQSARLPVTDSDELDRFFDLEKRLALSLYSALGVELTVAERERVLTRPTENINALLAFGLALEAEDRGDFETAEREYERAASLDPGFTLAESRSSSLTSMMQADQTTIAVLVEEFAPAEGVELPEAPPASSVSTAPTAPTNPAAAAAGAAGVSFAPTTGTIGQTGGLPDPFRRDAGAEVLGNEGIGARSLLRVIFIRPSN